MADITEIKLLNGSVGAIKDTNAFHTKSELYISEEEQSGTDLTLVTTGEKYNWNHNSALPAVTSSDNGKVLSVVNGAWAAASLQAWQGGSY